MVESCSGEGREGGCSVLMWDVVGDDPPGTPLTLRNREVCRVPVAVLGGSSTSTRCLQYQTRVPYGKISSASPSDVTDDGRWLVVVGVRHGFPVKQFQIC